MKKFKQLTSLVLALLMMCTSFAWNRLQVQATDIVTKDVTVLYYDSEKDEIVGENVAGKYSISAEDDVISFGNNNFISLEVQPEWKKVTIEFQYNSTTREGANSVVSFGGTEVVDYVWKRDTETNWNSVIVVLVKDEETGNWTSSYSLNNGEYTTIDYITETGTANGTVDADDEKIYIGRDLEYGSGAGTFKIKYPVITATKPRTDAKVDGVEIATLKEALTVAKTATDQTVTLLDDVTVTDDELLLTGGITLDLAGNDLDLGTTSYLGAFAGANVIDSVGGGLLKVADSKLMLPTNNLYMPVYDSSDAENAGYRFVDFTMIAGYGTDSEKIAALTSDYIYMNLEPDFGTDANTLLGSNAADTGVRIGVCLSWTTDNKTHEQNCWFDDEFVQAAYADGLLTSGTVNNVMYLIVEGLNDYADIKATPFVVSKALGVKKLHSNSASKTIYNSN